MIRKMLNLSILNCTVLKPITRKWNRLKFINYLHNNANKE